MEKDTRTAWGQEFDARRQAETELADVKRALARTKDERDALAREVDEANERVAAANEQRDALAARIQTAERVEKIFSETAELTFDDCLKLFADEIRDAQAKAGRKGFIAGACKWVAAVHPDYADDATADIEADAELYAAKVRQGGAE